jgi:hypothetical protein
MKTFGEIAYVGAGLGGGFEHTAELHVTNYEEAMKTVDANSWKVDVEEEHNRMVENEGRTPVPKSEVPVGAKVLTSTWAMKKKANGTFRARLNGRGFEQVTGPPRVEHLDVVGRLTPSMKWKPRIHNAPLTCKPGGSASNETCARCRCNLN